MKWGNDRRRNSMPMTDHSYYDRKKKISFIRRLAPIWWFLIVGCPLLIAILYKIGFRLEHIR